MGSTRVDAGKPSTDFFFVMIETWKDIPGYEGYYQASNLGNIKSLNYRHTGKEYFLKPYQVGKGYQVGDGYLVVSLWKDGIFKQYKVHRLVWMAFNGPIPKGMQINHIDEVKTNNNIVNLSLVTPSENTNWGTRNYRDAKKQRKMVEQYTLDGTHICTWFSLIGIQRELGYSAGGISNYISGRVKTAYGYVWKYKN